jgi:mannosyl-3-phosphoglycerate phosphatase
MKKVIVFTDLDGTLLDYYTYSFEKAVPALELLKGKNIPLVICSSKTRREIEYYRKKMDNRHPFISENGGGIFIPKDYFDFRIQPPDVEIVNEDDYHIIRLGARYSELRNMIEILRREGYRVKGFGDMTAEELARITNLSIEEAEMSKERDFDEPFVFEGDKAGAQKLLNAIKTKGFNYTQGRFFHILGNCDKGKAVSILTALYKKKLGEIMTIAIGDSANDIPMLERVNYPIIVQKPEGGYDQKINIPHLIEASGIGPEGWNNEIIRLICKQDL